MDQQAFVLDISFSTTGYVVLGVLLVYVFAIATASLFSGGDAQIRDAASPITPKTRSTPFTRSSGARQHDATSSSNVPLYNIQGTRVLERLALPLNHRTEGEFCARPSFLTRIVFAHDFQGFVNLFFVLVFAWAARELVSLNAKRGVLLDLELLLSSTEQAPSSFTVYAICTLWSCTVWVAQWLCYYGYIHQHTRAVAYRIFQCFIYYIPMRFVLWSNMRPVPAWFVTFTMIIMSFKMHSYYASWVVYERENEAEKRTIRPDLKNWILYLCMPTLVFKIHGYPRTSEIRISYLLEKIVQATVILLFIYVLVTKNLLPEFKAATQISAMEFIAATLIPGIALSLLFFFLVFETVLHFFAEVTCFADREFYQDWWNSTSFAEFSRKWNRPVHDYLHTHVYKASRRFLGESAASARLNTFLFSAFLHELCLLVMFRFFRMYLFILMLFQIPLMAAMSHSFFKTRFGKVLANVFFWVSLFTGETVLFLVYARDYALA